MSEEKKDTTESAAKTFTQEQLDNIIKDRLARTEEKYKDYNDLKKYREESESQKNALTQKQLEDQRNYEEAKKTLQKQVEERDSALKQKAAEITDMKIDNSLSGEISRQNGYVEEAKALLKSNAIVTETGEVKIKGKDANGIDTLLTVEQGIKQFLTQRPHLVKAANRGGGGTPPGGDGGGAGAGAQDLTALNDQLFQAMQSGNTKRAGELKTQIKVILAANRAANK